MSAVSAFLSQYVVPTAVLVSAGATTTTAWIAWQLYQTVNQHDRALFGEQSVEGHDGIVHAVNENTERSERNRQILQVNDLDYPRDFYRGGGGDPRGEGDEDRWHGT